MCRHGYKHIVDLHTLRLSFAENKCFKKVFRAAGVSHAGSNSTEITLYVCTCKYRMIIRDKLFQLTEREDFFLVAM